MLPIAASLLPFIMVVGLIIRRTGHYRWAIWSGWLITIAGSGLLLTFDSNSKTYAWVIIFLVIGLGHGLILLSLNICTQAMVEHQDAGQAAIMYTFLRSVRLCISASVRSTVFQNTLQIHLESQGLPPGLASTAQSLLAELSALPLRDRFATAIAGSIRNIAELLVGIAVAGGL